MAKLVIPDELRTLIEPLLPPEQPKPKGGRPPTPHLAALTGILFVLKSGKTGPNPTDRGRAGSKRHLITDAGGLPLAVRLTAASLHDSRFCEELIDAVPPIRRGICRPQRRPAKLPAEKGYGFPQYRRALRRRSIRPRIARCGIESGKRLGPHRRIVERTLAWFSRFRRLTIRCERRADIFEALSPPASFAGASSSGPVRRS